MRRVLILLLFFVSPFLHAQSFHLTGTVQDSATGEKLPFVTVLVNENGTQGVSTDIDGNFTIKSTKPITLLRFSYVGYYQKIMHLTPADEGKALNVLLIPQQQQLEDVTVFAGENPANRIIRQALKNKDRNDYSKLPSYAYKAYEKFTVTGIPPKSGFSDSLRTKIFRFLGDNHLMILESVVEKKHLAPDNNKETVLAQKVSGLDNPNFTVLISELQTTNFYQPYINIATTDFVNPISPDSWNKYFFNIEDTMYSGGDTVYVMSYRPWKGKHFSSLKGMLEINTDGYAIQRVTATPSDTSLATLFVDIEQRYSKVDSIHWFPEYLGLNIGFKKFVWEGLKVTMAGKTYIKDPVINAPLTKKDFDGVNIELLGDLKKDDTFWNANRLDTLTTKEQRTYHLLDSLNRRYHFDRKFEWANALQDGLYRLPYVSIELYNSIKYNTPEFLRLGLGLQTNSDFSKHYVLSAFAAYGLRDALWKYGGGLTWKIYEPKNITLSYRASMNYEEDGGLNFFQGDYFGSGTGLRTYTITNFDFVNRQQLDFTARIRKYLNVQASAFSTLKKVTGAYQFMNDAGGEPVPENQFHFTGVQAALRFSYKEHVVQSLDHYYWVNTGHPVFWFQVTRGFKGFLEGDFDYTKYEAQVSYYFNTKSFGITSFTVNGGIVDGILPSPELYAGRSSYEPFGLYAPGSFQTMRSGEFLDDRFAALYFKQDFLQNVIRIGRFQPNFVFVTNIAWGTLLHPEVHLNENFQSMNKGYFESGLVINNIIRKKFFGIVRLGAGLGVFYRYGAYAFSHELDNFAFKGTFSYNFK